MKYYWLSLVDTRNNNWILFRESAQRVELRERYRALSCANCGKLSEDVAIDNGIDDDVKIRARQDILRTNDGFICLSQRLASILSVNNISGLRLVGLSRSTYFIGIPVNPIPVENGIVESHEKDELGLEAIMVDPRRIGTARRKTLICIDKCGMEFRNPCPQCGRYQLSLNWPKRSSMLAMSGENSLEAPAIAFENARSRETWLLASERVISVLQAGNVTGFDPVEATG